MNNRFLVCLMLGALALSAADTKGSNKSANKNAPAPAPPGPKPEDLTWPLPPDPPRIKWVTAFSDMAKIKNPVQKKSGWMDKVTGQKAPDERIELRKPYGITTDSRGRIYTADTELKMIFVVDLVNKQVERREGTSRAPLSMPVGVAVDSEDRLFVSDADLHSIICFDSNGQTIGRFGMTNLGRPGGIALDKTRNRLYVADAKESRIAVFDSAAMKFLAYYGSPSKPGRRDKGTFLAPTNVALDRRGNIYVSDTWNYRVQVLDPDGKFLRAFGAQGDRPGEFIRPKGIAVDSEGHVYVADAEFNNFQILTSEGKPLLAVGMLGSEPGQFALIAGLHIDSKDQVFTTEMFRGRVQMFQYIRQPGEAPAAEKGVIKASTH